MLRDRMQMNECTKRSTKPNNSYYQIQDDDELPE